MQDMLIMTISNRIFKRAMPEYNQPYPIQSLFEKNFQDLDMQRILNYSFLTFKQVIEMMEEKSARAIWLAFLERVVLLYLQSLMNSSGKIKQKSLEAINKIKDDQLAICERFGQFMTQRQVNMGVEVLDDLVSFFECSPAFISVPCEKLRKT